MINYIEKDKLMPHVFIYRPTEVLPYAVFKKKIKVRFVRMIEYRQ